MTNFYLSMQKEIENLKANKKRPKLLLHSCCAVCSTAVIEFLKDAFDLTVFYFNPNIYPLEEYSLRLKEQKRYLEIVGIPIIEGEYDENKFLEKVKGKEAEKEGGKRCEDCIAFRLEETAKKAKENGFEYFCTTLSVSPHKNAEFINRVGEELSKKENVKFLVADFKKKDGFLLSTKLAKKYQIYRQNYCGCRFSKTNIE